MEKLTQGKYHKDVPMEHRTPQRDKDWFLSELGVVMKNNEKKIPDPQNVIRVTIFDFETTGIGKDDEAIELAYAMCLVCKKTFLLQKIERVEDMLNEPKDKTISEEITDLTGLTNEMVKGHKIPWDKVEKDFLSSDVLIAHNVRFDRRFLSKYLHEKVVNTILFACSAHCVPWLKLGFINYKQENLALYHGADFNGHRADADVLALVWVVFNFGYFNYIAEDIKTEYVLVKAIKVDKKYKDILKEKYRFMWPGDNKNFYWFKVMKKTDFEDIKAEFEEDFYPGQKHYEVRPVAVRERFLEPRDLL